MRKAFVYLMLAAACGSWNRLGAAETDCSTACLLELNNRVLDSISLHDASRLPLAAGLTATENGKPTTPGEGIWKTVTAIPYRQTIVDPAAGQSVVYGAIEEQAGQRALIVLRMAVKRREIAEIELLVSRKGAHPIYNPDGLGNSPRPIWNQIVPESERSPRAKLIEVADSYFNGIEKHTGFSTPFHPDCNRFENGVQTTNAPPSMIDGCSIGIAGIAYISKVRDRRYPLVDEARGIVLAIVHFDVPGSPAPAGANATTTALATTPRTLLLYELFKVEAGYIKEIQAFMMNAPLGASVGWK
jgi:hypothetical protein